MCICSYIKTLFNNTLTGPEGPFQGSLLLWICTKSMHSYIYVKNFDLPTEESIGNSSSLPLSIVRTVSSSSITGTPPLPTNESNAAPLTST